MTNPTVSVTRRGKTLRVEFEHSSALTTYQAPPDASEVTRLELVESVVNELPERVERELSLDPLLQSFPHLDELVIASHVFPSVLHHAGAREAKLSGGVALTPIAMPRLESLRLEVMGHVAVPFELFAWLLSGEGLPRLVSLDVRGLHVELSKPRPSFVERWATAPIVPRLRWLGLPGDEVRVAQLRNCLGSFQHLEALVISRLLSATDKNPVGANVYFESELIEVPLREVASTIASLRLLEDLMGDDDLESALTRLREAPVRYDERSLAAAIGRFCKRARWDRLERLLELQGESALPTGLHECAGNHSGANRMGEE